MDKAILDFIAKYMHSDWLNPILKFFTILGEAKVFVFLLIAFCGILLIFSKHRRVAIIILSCAIVGFLVGNIILKNIIARDRPCVTYPEQSYFIPCPSEYSMPSGHTLHTFLIAFTLLFNKKYKISIPTFIIAAIIAFSRMYFYVHYFTDILFGIILAATIAYLITLLFNKNKYLKNLFNIQ